MENVGIRVFLVSRFMESHVHDEHDGGHFTVYVRCRSMEIPVRRQSIRVRHAPAVVRCGYRAIVFNARRPIESAWTSYVHVPHDEYGSVLYACPAFVDLWNSGLVMAGSVSSELLAAAGISFNDESDHLYGIVYTLVFLLPHAG